jgi:hypothetical protein
MGGGTGEAEPAWRPAPGRIGRGDALAIGAWTAAIVAFFWDVVTLRGALFYFDITEINYPYRHFLAEELRAGRFSKWIPGLNCGHPIYSESQAGYLHPFKFLFYPWLPTWQALNLECVFSVWLTGMGTYGWLRRHVGPAGALTGAAVLGLSGFTWAHFVHTSMLNALASVPFVFWGVELAWAGMWRRGVVMASVALACQIFAGHLQDAILTGLAVGVYGAYRAAVEEGWRRKLWALGAVGLVGLFGILLSAVQWVPSKELIDRSPRAGGLTWEEITYGSWHPELLPTVLVRQAYGTRARDTDWMDGFYPYHEMNVFVGVIGLALAVVGAGAYRDRWVGAWLVVGGVGVLLMLGRFTFLFDVMPHLPFIGTGRVPVRYHLWVAVAAAALAAVGVDRLARVDCGRVPLRGAGRALGLIALMSAPILVHAYLPAFTERGRWPLRYHAERYAWLAEELAWAAGLTLAIGAAGAVVARAASGSTDPRRRAWLGAALPLLVVGELLGSHATEVPTIDPSYWTREPVSAEWLKERPGLGRIYGESVKASGEPGYASHAVDFETPRQQLAWATPPVWGLATTGIATPIKPERRLRFTEALGPVRLRIEGLTHVVTGSADAAPRLGPGVKVGSVFIHEVNGAKPRTWFAGRVRYAGSEDEAAALLKTIEPEALEVIVVEDPERPVDENGGARGTARIVEEAPDRVAVEVEADGPGYLFLADTHDPGWTAMVDGAPAAIRPADVCFRAVAVPGGRHWVEMTYEPAGWRTGLALSGVGVLGLAGLGMVRRRPPILGADHGSSGWPARWPAWLAAVMVAIVLASAPAFEGGRLVAQRRWERSWHTFTWGAGIEAIGVAAGG